MGNQERRLADLLCPQVLRGHRGRHAGRQPSVRGKPAARHVYVTIVATVPVL